MSVDCGHQREAGITCASCLNGNVRLANGDSLMGQVEVCGNQQWNTICDSMFSDEAAGVVCRQLGHSQFGESVMSCAVQLVMFSCIGIVGIFIENVY